METQIVKMNFNDRFVVLKHVLIGIIIFYFIIHPLTMVIYWFEFNGVEFDTAQYFDIVAERFKDSFSFKMMGMSSVFIILGALVGLTSGLYYRKILQKDRMLKQQEKQLERNIEAIIKNGENEKTEFKSSFRYDYVNERMNKTLETVFLKTVTGFLNATGGTLLIGVDDDGNILGLEKDYFTLKKKNRDGLELKLMQLISSNIGTEFCSLVHISFYKLEGKDICSVEVGQSTVPAYVNLKGKTVFYLRTGNSTKQLTVQETVNYVTFKNGKA
ncbi:MAG TPA: ATP-binding protein [Bacteroidetes bacterium]|nr:ATP-binding protein [Bacteroidota bacterium]